MTRNRLASLPLVLFSLTVFLAISIAPALAADVHWTNAAGGNWNTAANWNSGAGPVPGASDNAIIDLAGTYTVTVDVNPTVTSISLGAASGTQTLSSQGHTITISAASTIGANGVLLLTGSSIAGTGSVDNQGTITSHTSTAFNVALTTASGSLLRVEGANGASTLTFANGFTNNGAIELTSVGLGYASTLNVTTGTLINEAGRSISILVGAGGARTLGAQLDNRGTLTVGAPLTIAKASADHLNSGTLDLSGEDLSLNQTGTTPSFTTTGTITIGATHTLTVSGGAFDYNAGSITGGGSLAFSSATWNLGISFTNSLTGLSLSGTTVNGPGILTNATGKSLVLAGCTINADLVNDGTLVSHTTSAINGAFTTSSTSDLQVEGANGASTLTFANGFTNNGTIELTSVGLGYASALNVTTGTLVNEAGKSISILVGAGGARTLGAQLDNRGTLTVGAPLTIGKASADHLNSGTIDVTGADMAVSQTGTTPSFASSGVITVGATRTLTVNGGTLTNSPGGVLEGDGTLVVSATSFTNTGDINPGTSPGILTITGSPTQSTPGAVNFEIGGATPGSDQDQLAVSGTATLGGAINATLINGFTPSLGDSFVVMTTGTTSGQFDTQNLPALGGGIEFQVGYRPASVVLKVVSPTAVTISIDNVTVTEGNSGTTDAVFTVSLSEASSQTITVDFATADNTAIAPADYAPQSGTLTFAPSVTTQQVTVPVNGDALDEPDETFFVNLTAPTNATIADNQGQGTITDDDPTPSLSIDDVIVTEGNSGTATASFTVSLSAPSGRAVTVSYATADNSATAPTDYAAGSGTLTFPAGTTIQPVNVAVNGDALDEPDETFFVNLSNAANATIADNQGQGTITDDDPTPSLGIGDVVVSEGAGSAVFTVTLSAASGRTVTVDFATGDNSATSPGDYAATSGTLTFPPGSVSQTIPVTIVDDALVESSETFLVILSNPGNATLGTSSATGSILDDDSAASVFSIDDVTVGEGAGVATFTVLRSGGTTATSTVDYTTADGTAAAPGDYGSKSGTLTFSPGTATQTVTVTVNDDLLNEPLETFFVNLSNATGATIADPQGMGTITDDDPLPSLSIGDVTVTEGNSGTVSAVFVVTLSAASGRTVTVDWATADDTATDPADYAGGSGTVTFSPGVATQSVTVAVNGDLVDEPDETFFVNLTAPSNATIADDQGVGTITDDDSPPTISINDVSVNEGNSGTTNATLAVTLSAASSLTVTVDWATTDGTAMAPADYASGSGTLTFPPGTTSQSVTVTVNGDVDDEPDETFFVDLSNPANATIADPQGQGTIVNDERVIVPQQREWWRHHLDVAALYLPISLGTVTVGTTDQATLVLKFGDGPDWNHKLRAELLATILNLAYGAANGACIQSTVDEAQSFLDANGTKRLTKKSYHSLADEAQDLMLKLRAYNDGHAPCFPTSATTLAERQAPDARAVSLGPSVPNPFNGQARIQYTLPTAARARLVVYDVQGRAVRVLVDQVQGPGSQWVIWDGKTRTGAPVASGVYYYRLTVEGSSRLGRMILSK